ncbi:MAG: hypothetical protein JJU08_14445 [Rhodobacteraceae bacterium]|nr:hypothetical protein [Paracoccaceae bacterium]
MKWLVSILTGGVVQQFTAPLLEAHRQRLAAQNNTDRIAAEQEIARLEAARDVALAESSDRFSATRIGRLLIVVPFGLWWAAVFGVSIINPLFGLAWSIDDIPPRFWDAALVLIPAIILGDAGALALKRWA